MTPYRSCRLEADPKWPSSWTSGTCTESAPTSNSAPDNWNGDLEPSDDWRRPSGPEGEVRRCRSNRCRTRFWLRRRERVEEEAIRRFRRRHLRFPGFRGLSSFSCEPSWRVMALRLVCDNVRGGRSVVPVTKDSIWGRSRSKDIRWFWKIEKRFLSS